MQIKALTVEHPLLSVGEVLNLATATPLERSGHIGNQNLTELTVLSLPNVQPIMVDTIHGRDKYSQPGALLLNGMAHRLASNSRANNRLVGAIHPDATVLEQVAANHPQLELQAGYPNLTALHQASLGSLGLTIQIPRTLSEFMQQQGETSEALMEQLAVQGLVRRITAGDGAIKQLPDIDGLALKQCGVFGLKDNTPVNLGALLPLEGMLALDILAASDHTDTVHHLAGKDMRLYTQDPALMGAVADTVAGTLERLGRKTTPMRYVVIDVSNIAAAVAPEQQTIASQYDLLTHTAEGGAQHITIPANNHHLPAFNT